LLLADEERKSPPQTRRFETKSGDISCFSFPRCVGAHTGMVGN